MKVQLKYCVEYTKEIEMPPDEYCYLRSNFNYGNFFPKDSFSRKMKIDNKAEKELNDFYDSYKTISTKCRNCEYIDYDETFGWVCQHKASMEGIEAEKNFYTLDEIEECDFYLKRTTE